MNSPGWGMSMRTDDALQWWGQSNWALCSFGSDGCLRNMSSVGTPILGSSAQGMHFTNIFAAGSPAANLVRNALAGSPGRAMVSLQGRSYLARCDANADGAVLTCVSQPEPDPLEGHGMTPTVASIFEAALRLAPDAISVLDVDGNIRAYNDRFLAIWDLTANDVDCLPPDEVRVAMSSVLEDPPQFLMRMRAMLASRPDDRVPTDRLRFKDGRVIEHATMPSRMGDRIVGWVINDRDETDRERALERATLLADAGRLLGALDFERAVESLGALLVPRVMDGFVVDALVETNGPRRVYAVGVDTDLPSRLQPDVLARSASVRTIGERMHVSIPLKASDRLIGTMTLVGRAGRPLEPLLGLEDAKELGRRIELALENARLHDEARRAVASRDELIGIAAHEIRGPLTALGLAVDSLARTDDGPTRVRAIDIIRREESRLAKFATDLLEAVRLRSRGIDLEMDWFDLDDLLEEVVTQHSLEILRSGSHVAITGQRGLRGLWDRQRLLHALAQVLSNAVKFGRGKPIELNVEQTDHHVSIHVTDHGVGIAPEKIDSLFQPFKRGISARNYGGLGLGLFITRKIAEALGGSVGMQSEPGAGTTITIELPLGEEAHAA